MKVLGLIPARAGSKGVLGKNTRPLAGRSLIERAFACASASRALDRIILSTDDPDAMRIARQCGLEVPFERPAHLARDDTPMLDVVTHALRTLQAGDYAADAVLILQPTSPLRAPHHIQRAIGMLGAYSSVCSVVPLPPTLSPYYVMRLRADGCLDHYLDDGARITRRQDTPPAYVRDGTVYLVRVETILNERSLYGQRCLPMILDESESLSIDGEDDWLEAERRLQTSQT